jgi:uncharacterized protein (DUF1501 family)
MTTRRIFLKGSAIAMVGVGAAPGWLARAAAAEDGRRKKILVAIFQRGAADGLNMVVPFTEKNYYQLRPTLAVPKPGQTNGAIDLDSRFGLNPELEPLKALYDKGLLAIVQAVGSPDPTRSHFDAQDFMESGTPGRKSTSDGWLNRALSIEQKPSPVRAISMGPQLPRTLRGNRGAVAINNIKDFQVQDQEAAGMFETMYAQSNDAQLKGSGKNTFEALKLVETINRQPYRPGGNAQYPNGRLGQSLQQVARLIKSDAGVEVAFADIGGWDHHTQEAGRLPPLLREFGQSLAAFAQDMGDRMEDIVVVTMSEFGRTAKENGGRGTDHGHGGLMFAMGGPINGGKIHGPWPGLEQEQLYEGRDLAVTTDFRAILGEMVTGHLGQTNLAGVFPGYQFTAPFGLLRA